MTIAEVEDLAEAVKTTIQENEDDINQFFLLTMGAIVMFMQAGFAFLEAGSVRSKNVTNILIKNFLDFFAGAIVYWAVGFGFAYGDLLESSNSFIGNHGFFATKQFMGSKFYVYWFFNFVFAATSATIISGAVAERTQFGAYFIYTLGMIGFIFPCVCHWVWSPIGWLKNAEATAGAAMHGVKFIDFAGAGVVHLTGGIAALLGAYFIGPRIGRYKDGKVQFMPGHSVPIAALGGFILFLGFLCFNGGSEMMIVDEYTDDLVAPVESHGLRVSRAFMNSILGGAGGAISALLCGYVFALIKRQTPYWSLLICMNGGLAGMVASCAGCDNMIGISAISIGLAAGFTYYWASELVRWAEIDDPLDAFAVHYGGGFTGILIAPLLVFDGVVYWETCAKQEAAWNDPTPFVCDLTPFKAWAWNLMGLVVITVWSGGLTGLIFYFLNSFELLRVDRNTERRGLDIRKHNEPAYPTAAYGHGYEQDDPRAAGYKA